MRKNTGNGNGEDAFREWLSDNLRYIVLCIVVMIAIVAAVTVSSLIDGVRNGFGQRRFQGNAEDAAEARHLHDTLRASVRRHLLNLDTMSAVDRVQTAQAMAIHYGLFEPAEARQAFDVLLELIENNGGSFDCGILGMRVIFHVLSRFGRSDLAFRMITKKDFPSYGYLIAHGATTLWELMSSIERVQSSCNHHFFGDVASWFIQYVGGIRQNPFGEDVNEVHIAPSFIDALDHAAASLETPTGVVRSSWRRDGEDILLDVEIPDGMRGELRLMPGWKTDEGYTSLTLDGKKQIRIFPADKPDILRRFAK
jgi:alpha-L-rhamnosidase